MGIIWNDLRPNPLEQQDKDDPKIAVVYVEGAIVDGWGDDGESVGGDEVARRIRKIRKESDSYKAIVLRINSPGGSVSGSEAILFELIRARKAGLPVVVSMGPVAASEVIGLPLLVIKFWPAPKL